MGQRGEGWQLPWACCAVMLTSGSRPPLSNAYCTLHSKWQLVILECVSPPNRVKRNFSTTYIVENTEIRHIVGHIQDFPVMWKCLKRALPFGQRGGKGPHGGACSYNLIVGSNLFYCIFLSSWLVFKILKICQLHKVYSIIPNCLELSTKGKKIYIVYNIVAFLIKTLNWNA